MIIHDSVSILVRGCGDLAARSVGGESSSTRRHSTIDIVGVNTSYVDEDAFGNLCGNGGCPACGGPPIEPLVVIRVMPASFDITGMRRTCVTRSPRCRWTNVGAGRKIRGARARTLELSPHATVKARLA